jgi:hypothetical protein
MTWYEENVEEPIRPLVRLLRDNGYNTFSSCGHDMNVIMDYKNSMIKLMDLLNNNGYHNWRITGKMEQRWNLQPSLYDSITVELLKDENDKYDHGLKPLEGKNTENPA